MTRALWVGGPPGATLLGIRRKLACDGIEVVEVQESFRSLPSRTDLVLINIDMVNHGSFDAARAAAELRSTTWVAARTDYSRTRRALDAAHLLPANADGSTEEHVAEDPELTSQELDDFLRRVPKELLPHAKTIVASRLREDDVLGAAQHLNQLDADGLVELLALIDPDKRKHILTALDK
ncbi:MAG: hypothetical protein IT383_19900 [Deltaproteobacteria bacterium]|nr:hypothetical protein [Deltaproteobacteria bacterium]